LQHRIVSTIGITITTVKIGCVVVMKDWNRVPSTCLTP